MSRHPNSATMMRGLIAAGARLDTELYFSYLKEAYGDEINGEEKAQILIEAGYPINKGDRWGTILKTALERYPNYNMDFIMYLLRRGANTLDTDDPNPLLIQVITLFNYYRFWSNLDPEKEVFINFVMTALLAVLPPAELQRRGPTGESAYMAAIKYRLPAPLTEILKARTGATNANKNAYGRTAAFYRRYIN